MVERTCGCEAQLLILFARSICIIVPRILEFAHDCRIIAYLVRIQYRWKWRSEAFNQPSSNIRLTIAMGPKIVSKRDKTAPKPDEGVSSKSSLYLDISPGSTNISTYISFKDRAVIELGKIGAAAAFTMSSGERYDVEQPEEPNIPAEASELRKKAIEAEYIELVKIAAKQDKQLDLKIYPEAFAFILGCLGPSSKDRVISNMGAEKWQAASVKGDFVELVQALDKSHLSDSGTVTESDKQRLIKAFNNIRQRKDESTADYYQRVENLIRGFEPISLEKPEDWQQASAYIAGLDNERYSQFKADTENYAKLKIKAFPTNLAEAHQRAVEYVIPRIPSSVASIAMAASQALKNSGKTEKARSEDTTPATASTGRDSTGATAGGGGRGRGGRGGRGRGSGGRLSSGDRRCFVCNEMGHLARNCPLKGETDDVVEESKQHIVAAVVYTMSSPEND